MAKKKGSPRARPAPADEPLRRGRKDEQPARAGPELAEELVRAVRVVARESEIYPGIPLS